jgi:hypothetical protein
LLAAAGDLSKRLGVRNPPLTSFRLNNLLTNAVFDMSPIQSLSGECPYTLEAGVRITVEWMRRGSAAMKALPGDIEFRSKWSNT